LKEYIDDFITETKNMEICRGTNMDNINTVFFYEYFQTEDEFCIVEELCDTSLMQLILDGKKFSVQEIYQILSQLNNTFKIIKEANLSYRGLRLDKILIKKNEKGEYIYKLNGLSYDKKIYNLLGAVGFMRNEKYKAPELLNNLLISKNMTSNELNLKYQKADIWSLGIIIFILYFGEFPYEGNRAREILSNIRKNENVRLNEINDPELKDLLKKMLTEDKDERIDWDSYFSHKFFSREKWA
jgi:serine/threonine protein kinase